MEYLTFQDASGKEIKISRLVLGGSSKQMGEGTYPDSFYDCLLENGIQTVDLGRIYGHGKAESNFAKVYASHPRDAFTIITKCCHPKYGIFKRVNRKAAFSDIENSLQALNTSYVDVLLLHRDDEHVPIETIITFMNDIVKKGYARSIGVSNWSIDRIKKANDYARGHGLVPFKVLEPQFSYVIREKDPWHNGSKSLTGKEHEQDLAWLKENHIICPCYSSLADGYLSGKKKSNDPDFRNSLSRFAKTAYDSKENRERLSRLETLSKKKGIPVPTLALAYVLHQDFNTACIVSMSSEKRILSNVKALDITFSEEELSFLQ